VQESGVGNLSLIDRGGHNRSTDHTVQATETAVLSAKVINETRFQLFHADNNRQANTILPALSVSGSFSSGGSQVGHSFNTSNRYELQNYTSIANGAHSWKFGVRVRAVSESDTSPSNFGGAYTFAGGYAPILDTNNQPVVPGIVCTQSSPSAGCATITDARCASSRWDFRRHRSRCSEEARRSSASTPGILSPTWIKWI
jgi:hypothetical protein